MSLWTSRCSPSPKAPPLPNVSYIAQITQLMLPAWFWSHLHLRTLFIQTSNFLPSSAQRSATCILLIEEEIPIPRYITRIFLRSSRVTSWFNQLQNMNFSNKTWHRYNKNETWSEFACQPKQNYIPSLSSFGQKTYVLVKCNQCGNLLRNHHRV